MVAADVQYRRLVSWIESDPWRMHALRCVSGLGLQDWCIAAGFVRNLAWDRIHAYPESTPLNDIDVIYFDHRDTSTDCDTELERRLSATAPYPWSVKNQARMHGRNGDKPYLDTSHAMSHWVELETAVGATLKGEKVRLVAPLGINTLFRNTVTINPRRAKPEDFQRRIREKQWLQQWPALRVVDC